MTKTMVPRFEILLDCNNKVPELRKEDATWVPTDWADYMDPDAMTTLLGDHVCNIEEEEYWEACQHTLKSSYELKTIDEDEERGVALSDDEDGSEDKSDSSSDNNNDSGLDDDDSSTDSDDNNGRSYDSPYNGDDLGEPTSDKEDEDANLFYEEYKNDMDYYDQDIEDDAEANRWSDTDSDQYRLINVLENAKEENAQANQVYHDEYPYRHLSNWSDITIVSSRYGPRYNKHLPQSTDMGNKGKHNLFDEWMDSIEHLDAFVIDKPTNMELEEEVTNYMDVNPTVLMLREEGVYWEPPAIVEATTKLKNWASEGAAHPIEDFVRKIKTVNSVTFAKRIKTTEPVTLAKNIVSVPIEYISANVSILVKYAYDSFPVESVESFKNSFPFNMISDSAYLLALNVFISEIGKETLNNI